MTALGELAFWAAIPFAAWAVLGLGAGRPLGREDLRESGARGLIAAGALGIAAMALLIGAFARRDFSIAAVAAHTASNLPMPHAVAASWAGRGGAWLLLAACLGGTAVIGRPRRRVPTGDEAAAGAALATLLLLVLGAIAAGANPFARVEWAPHDGAGLHPSLQTPGFLIHPPMLALATALMAAAAGRALAVVAAPERAGRAWRAMTGWLAAAWGALTIALVSGMWWASGTSDADASWVRDPVMHATLAPWTAATLALLAARRGTRSATARGAVVALIAVASALGLAIALTTLNGLLSASDTLTRSPAGAAVVLVIALAAGTVGWLAATRVTAGPDGAADARPPALVLTVAGAAACALALGASAFAKRYEAEARAGETVLARDAFGGEWRFSSQGVSRYAARNREVTAVGLAVSRNGRREALLAPEIRQYVNGRGEPLGPPASWSAIRPGVLTDVRATLQRVQREEARLLIDLQPLVSWMWIGGLLLAVGGTWWAWPPRRQEGDRR